MPLKICQSSASSMAVYLYECPNTGYRVQGWSADEVSSDDTYETVTCEACKQLHLVNPATGRVLGKRLKNHNNKTR
jgi:hypothetical protein